MTSTDLLPIQQSAGAVVDDELRSTLVAGIGPAAPTAIHFGDPAAEYAAARDTAVVFDLSDRTQIEITGEDRATFLHNFCTNDIKKLQPGQGCEAFITNVKGRALGHVFVFAGPTSLWLDTVPGQEDALVNHLDRYVITEDVQIVRQSADWPCLYITGPRAAELLQALDLPAGDITLGDNRLVDGAFGVSRVDWFTRPGFELGVHKSHFAELWQRLVDGGISPAGAAAFHALRIEAGYPWYGCDITDENLPQEVGRTECAVSFTKGCYLGQEPIARLDAMGHVNKELCVLKLAEGSLPPAESVIHSAEDDREVGKIASAARLAPAAAAVALAYLRTAQTKPGTELTIDIAGTTVPAQVVERK